jgi:hypothetical protein
MQSGGSLVRTQYLPREKKAECVSVFGFFMDFRLNDFRLNDFRLNDFRLFLHEIG